MKRTLPWRKQPAGEPTKEQLEAAEDAVFSAMRRRNKVLVKSTSFQDRMMAEPDDDSIDGVASLSKTTVEDFISSFRVNGLECMTTAYE